MDLSVMGSPFQAVEAKVKMLREANEGGADLRAFDFELIELWDAMQSYLSRPATVQGLFDQLEEYGAALMQIVPRDENDVALRAVIVVRGQPETDEIITAVQAVEAGWNE